MTVDLFSLGVDIFWFYKVTDSPEPFSLRTVPLSTNLIED